MLKNKLAPISLLPVVLVEEAAEVPVVAAVAEVVVVYHHTPIHILLEPQAVVKVSDNKYSQNAPVCYVARCIEMHMLHVEYLSIHLSLLSLFSCTILQIENVKS